jgi:hypothetical protein
MHLMNSAGNVPGEFGGVARSGASAGAGFVVASSSSSPLQSARIRASATSARTSAVAERRGLT